MIRRSRRIYDMNQDLVQRIDLAHKSFTQIVTRLRNTSATVLTSEVIFWRDFFTAERARLLALRDTVGVILERVYPETFADAVDYAQTIPTMAGFFQQVIDLHTLPTEPLTNGQRTQLANAVEGELEA